MYKYIENYIFIHIFLFKSDSLFPCTSSRKPVIIHIYISDTVSDTIEIYSLFYDFGTKFS